MLIYHHPLHGSPLSAITQSQLRSKCAPFSLSRFLVEEPAPTNTTSGIVAAFDRALARYTEVLTDWSVVAGKKHSIAHGLDLTTGSKAVTRAPK